MCLCIQMSLLKAPKRKKRQSKRERERHMMETPFHRATGKAGVSDGA